MSDRPSFSSPLLNPSQDFSSKNASEAWLAVIIFSLTTILLISIGSVGSKILNIAFPFGSLVVGWFFYFRYPNFYIGFMWWSLFLTPLIRRLSDFRSGAFVDSSPILLAPSLIILISFHTMYFNLPKAREQGTAPFSLALASVIYAYFIGLLNPATSFVKASVAFLGWITPILFGYHLFVHWERYPDYSKTFKRVFLWGCLLVGLYGIYQYIVAPEWDRLWLVGSKMDSSAGKPEPFGMRVWSTINSPGPFADMITSSLLVVFSCKGGLVVPAAGAGILSLLLSAVRTGWLGWFGGLILFSSSLKPKQQLRLVLTVVVLLGCIIPLSTMEPFAGTIATRFSTLGDLQNDTSASIRQNIYKDFFENGIFNFMGDGIGVNDTVDAGILSLILDLGWIGALPYTASILLCAITLFKNLGKYRNDLFITTCCSVLVKSFAFFLATRVTAGIHGIIIWSFIGIGLAGQRYWNHQQSLQFNELLKGKEI
ncbi:O-antigen ligase domain-containing protein [Pseudanabaena sp. UWO310]|uniref:O-antigen ligase domain-containing protein n=1 Tax=Pseudanabaena sp. UWO310 TaxID=2480795 RepID=UPI001159D15A|nr:O-antigen ligase domain-containing protein [Pseudanabaena sp. UWO310]TYQ26054.1 O-antigen ligase domain-containing protein [Pseudanabaena sp. UWO310]